MAVAATIGAVGSLAGAGIQAYSAERGREAQADMFGKTQGAAAPFISAGHAALPTLQSLLTPGANQTATLSQTPGYQFAQDWGLKGLQSSFSGRGLGGNLMAEAAKFSSGLANQTLGTTISGLQGLVGSGVSATGTMAQAATSTGQGMAGSMMNAGNALGTSVAGIGNTFSGLQSMGMLSGITGAGRDIYGAAPAANSGGGSLAQLFSGAPTGWS